MFEFSWVRSAYRKLVPAFFAFSVLFALSVANEAAAYTPSTIPSLTKACYYKIYGTKYDGTAWSSGDWKAIACGTAAAPSSLNFTTLPNSFGTIPDGVYFIELTSVDNADNWMDSTKYGPYRVDTTPPKCDITDVKLLAGNSGNQYFDKATNTFYYKGTGGQGKFSVTVDSSAYTPGGAVPAKTCGAGGNEYCSAPLDTITFENTIGPGSDYKFPYDANLTSGTFAKTQTHTYDWNGNNSYTGNLLGGTWPSGCKDAAGNVTFFKPTNTKLTYEDGGLVVQPIGWMAFSPDSTAPSLATSNFYFKSGDDGNGANELLYSGNNVKYLSALSTRNVSASVSDGGAGVRPFDVNIEKALNSSAYSTYPFAASTYLSRVPGPVAINITHDFSNAGGTSSYDLNASGYRAYDWNINTKAIDGSTFMTDWICDMVGNCNPFPNTEFRIVANAPDVSKTQYSASAATKKIANGSDQHFARVKWRDKYDNWVIPVKGVKTFTTDVNFTNTLGLDQVTKTTADANYFTKGTGVDFFIEDGYNGALGGATHSASEKKDFKFVTDDPSDFGMGETWVKLASYVPTYSDYKDTRNNVSIYGSDATRAKLDLNQLKLTVAAQNGYTSVGQSAFACVGSSYQCSGGASQLNYSYVAPTYFSSLEKLEPVVENKIKELDLARTSSGSANPVTGYQLRTMLLTNNPFFGFYDFQLDGSGDKRDDMYYVAESNSTWPASQFSSVDSDSALRDVSFAGIDGTSTRVLSFIPKTVGGITNSSQNVALVTTMRYKVNGRYVQLPGVQSGLANYDKVYDALVTPGSVAYGTGPSSIYSSTSKLTLSEIDIRGIVQSKNDGSTNGLNAVTTSSASTKFRDFSSITLYDVKTNIQKNVAALISGANVSAGDLAGSKKTVSTNFSSVASGLKLQGGNVLYFKNGDVVIDCGGGDAVCDVSGAKTLIIENGNLYINSNIKYADGKSILGLILVGNKDGTKSHVYVSEKITNVSAVAYAEGAVQSYDGNASSPKVYDGKNVGEASLLNQLHWFGSLATRNTIGWGIKDPYSCPFGTPEYRQATCNDAKSHQYDLIYLRRYARADSTEYVGIVGNPMGDGKIPAGIDKSDVKIAGGIKFSMTTGTKTVGPAGLKTFSNLDTPLAVEYDSRLQTLPPPGFEKSN